jgi:hypothetical protein
MSARQAQGPGRAGGQAGSARRRLPTLGRLLCALLLAALLAACGETAKVTDQKECDKYLDSGDWDLAITSCGAIGTDEGTSKTAQAHMGHAGLTILDLMGKLQNSNLRGLELIVNVLTVDVASAPYDDLDQATTLILSIPATARSNTDNFNLALASDVLLASLFKSALGITVDSATGAMTIPGITDAGLSNLSASSPISAIQTAFANIYSATYYKSTPLAWDSGSATAPDLAKISKYVRANKAGSDALGLSTNPDLSNLDFATLIDNGQCGYGTGTTTPDPTQVAQRFPRRLNTSDSSAVFLADEQNYVIGTGKEWGASFLLPSALLNPDNFKVDCNGDGVASLGEFGACMASGKTAISTLALGQTNNLVLALTTTAGGAGGLCGGAACTSWPLLIIDGNPVTDESSTNGTQTRVELSQVLSAAYPIDNAADPGSATFDASLGVPCTAGDGWVNAREYDYYLRTFGQ